jgi:hypothetical protein
MTTLREEFEALMPEPFEYLYEFASPFGGVDRRTSPNQRNGSGPTRSVPVHTADQVREAMKAVAERCAVLVEEFDTANEITACWQEEIAAAIRGA